MYISKSRTLQALHINTEQQLTADIKGRSSQVRVAVELFLHFLLVKMDNEMFYSTLVFSKSDPEVPKDAKTENVVYSEIRRKKEEASLSNLVTDGKVSSVCELHNSFNKEDVASTRYGRYRQTTAVLGLLCVLLLAGLTTVCVLNIKHVSEYTSILTLYTNESTAHRKLQVDNAALETEKEELTAQRDQLTNTLLFITQYTTFPVSNYCTLTKEEVHCESCMKDWIRNGSSCYLFWKSNQWLTWSDSQKYCAAWGGHLVVIDTAEEPEFISQHIPFYYDKYHGYWIGLTKQDGMWVWITGTELQSNGFWTVRPKDSQANCVLAKPESALNNWEANYCYMKNRYICEMKVVEWPSQFSDSKGHLPE